MHASSSMDRISQWVVASQEIPSDVITVRMADEVLTTFPTSGAPAELAALSPASFSKVVTELRRRRADQEVIAAAVTAYAERVLADVLADPTRGNEEENGALLDSVVDAVLPPSTDDGPLPLPAAFLCRLLRAAVNSAGASAKTRRDLELRVAAVLDRATAGDLLGVALDGTGQRVANADTVRRVVEAFVEGQARATVSAATGRRRRASLSGGGGPEEELGGSSSSRRRRSALEKVARTVDDLAAEIATEAALPVSEFVGVAGAVPRDAPRATHDLLYRAVDVYLKAHPALDEVQREKVCSVMDPLRLSYQARLHASQNKRLPLQAVLTALYYDQLKLRSADDDDGAGEWDKQSAAGEARAQARADASLARENEALRLELARMRAYVSGMQHNTSKGSESRASSSSSVPAGKKKSFLGSVSRTLSRLNPFMGVRAKDTSSVADGRHVVKPKKRRFSIG